MVKLLRKASLKQTIKRQLLSLVKKFNIYCTYFLIPRGSTSLDKLETGAGILGLSSPKAMIGTKPITIDDEVYWHFAHYYNVFEQRTFVIKAKNWRVWGNQGAVITDKNYLLAEVSREFDSTDHSIHKQFKLKPFKSVNKKVAIIAASGADNYYHWMFDIIPRIGLIAKNRLLDEVEKFIINIDGRSFQNETLKRVNIEQSKIIISNNLFDFHIKATELIVPSLPSYNGCPSKASCEYLRELFFHEINGNKNDGHIYIQRLDARLLINEQEILLLLKPLNFRIVHPEKLSVAEQAKVFSSAKVVIGVHGAGFSNIVFCKPGTIVMEIFSPQWIMPCYWILSNQVSLTYGYIIGKSTKETNNARLSDISVDINDFKKILFKLGIC